MAIGEQDTPDTIDFVDWHDLYNGPEPEEAVIDGLAYPGRWTAIAAAAKAGKSTLLVALAVETAMNGQTVCYIDAEMGRVDMLERVDDWMDLKPDDLANLHYTDLPPKLDVLQGATILYHAVAKLHPSLVIIDGINGCLAGDENENITWRDMYEMAIAPLKQMGVAIISLTNVGHGDSKRPRGSSIQLDKADAILNLARTDTGVKLTATHRRTSNIPLEQEYTITGAEAGGEAMTWERTNQHAVPEGTRRICTLLDQLDVPLDAGKRTARKALKDAGHVAPRDTELLVMLRYRRREAVDNLLRVVPGTTPEPPEPPLLGGSQSGNHPPKPPGHGVVPPGFLYREPPGATGSESSGTDRGDEEPQIEYEDPFA